MAVTETQLATLKEFLQGTTRGVLMTRRKDGRIQSSPMSLVGDEDGTLLFTTRATAAKVRNLQRDPYAAVCIITERFLGAWIHAEGQAEIAFLPAALPALAAFYRQRQAAEDTETDAFKQRMADEGRCLIRVRVDHIVQPPARPAPRPAT
jgi:PPOX class probable F420-dependent enzyme